MTRKRKKNVHTKPTIGIYCEGQSEEKYFKMLCQKYNAGNVHAQRIRIDTLGESGRRLITAAAKKGKYSHQSQVYVIFDRDEKTDSELQLCQKLAKQYNVTILFSSICFEIWILMHFEPVMRAYTRRELFEKLSGPNYFNQNYLAFKGSSYREFLYDEVGTAVQNAKNLYTKNHKMSVDDPYTDVHLALAKIFKTNVF